MTLLQEAMGAPTPLQAALDAGLNVIDRSQTVVFTQYTKTVLPADGYVFWVPTNRTVSVNGSVHYGIDKEQNEDETIAINRVIFTAESKIQEFDAVCPTIMFLGTFEGLQFAFSQQGDFYAQAELFHYVGNAVYPAMSSQICSSAASLYALEPIVSNSLPIWIALNQFASVYPSFLVPDNIVPPYIVAHIGEEDTDTIAPLPGYNLGLTFPGGVPTFANPVPNESGFGYAVSDQLMKDHVRLTLYGFNNVQALAYRDYLFNYSVTTDAFGLVGMDPVIRDAKRTQREIGVIAQKKLIEMDVSYYQSAVGQLAQRLITSIAETVTIGAL